MPEDKTHMQGWTRRATLGGIAVAGGLQMSAVSGAAGSADLIAETTGGRLRGARAGNAIAFKGVRYAVAKRFMPPSRPHPWAGVQDAMSFGASAVQTNVNPPPGPPYVILAQLPRPANAPPPVKLPESEDCQFLNIWTSALKDGGKRPVMVWLHGGFFYGGTGSTVDGASLAARGDVVVVSLNHRLNAFGFSHLAEIGGADFAHSANVGMLDIIAALEWIRDNIEAFGGDPARVMVFGTSGGGMKTSFLMASPRARGLFSRAGVQSGPGLRFMERDRAAAVTDRLMHILELKPRDIGALRAMPAEKLLAGFHAVSQQMSPERFIDLPCFAPVIDEALLPRHPFSPDASPLACTIPMLIGSNAQEMSFFMGNDPQGFLLDEAGLADRARNLVGALAADLLPLYAKAYPGTSPSRRYIQLNSDYSVMLPAIAQAERMAARGGQAWLYRLDYQSPALDGTLGALHTMEGSLLFDTPAAGRALLGDGPAPALLAKRMSAAWVAFATNGDPNSAASGLPHWPTYDDQQRATMLFDVESRVMDDPAQAMREALGPALKI